MEDTDFQAVLGEVFEAIDKEVREMKGTLIAPIHARLDRLEAQIRGEKPKPPEEDADG